MSKRYNKQVVDEDFKAIKADGESMYSSSAFFIVTESLSSITC
ncbi:hypothetical protein [Bacillus kexueae]|nr:hypothetical protein [Bacillus kexueae]